MIVAARATARVQCAAPRARRHRSRRHRVARASSGVNDDDASDAAMYEELEKINAANNSKSASDWIGAWSKAITDPPSEAEVEKQKPTHWMRTFYERWNMGCPRWVGLVSVWTGWSCC